MRNNLSSFSCICIHSLSLLISVLGTAIFTFVTLVVFLVFGTLVTALAIISVIFFLVTLIALILLLNCFMQQTCRPPDEHRHDPY